VYVFPLAAIIMTALGLSLSKNGIGSFVTLGILGAAIYSIPAVIGVQSALATVSSAHRTYVPVPDPAEFVALMAWLGLLAGLLTSIFVFPRRSTPKEDGSDAVVRSVALASAILGIAGFLYFSYTLGALFFIEERGEQDVGAAWLLWRWTPLVGIVASSSGGQRKLFVANALVLFIIFLSGDRTMVAIVTAAWIAVASEKNPGWWRKLNPLQITAVSLGGLGVFFGKSAYLTMKSGLSGHGWSLLKLSAKDQFLFQFEPLTTFSHLSYVMMTGINIRLGQFFESIFGNILLIPSLFGISTNLYNLKVTATLSTRLDYGVAGNYLAHGYTVAGLAGAVAFYFILPLMLMLCDRQFHNRSGSVKIFWCCVGAVFAFYIHRNGLDNQLSFIRQLFIVCAICALLAGAIRQLGWNQTPRRGSMAQAVRAPGRDNEFALRGTGTT
jgi:hypothetical protein